MWQVLYTPDVWLLSNLGAQLGIQEEGDHWGNPTRCSRHHQSTGERISSCISRDCLQSVVRISAHLSQILSSNYRWGNQQISQFIGEKSAHLSQSLSLIDRENIISCISNIVFSQITEFMGWKVLLHKKAQGFKGSINKTINMGIWHYRDGPMYNGWCRRKTFKVVYVSQAGLTSIKSESKQSKRNCFYFDKLQTSTCSCTIFVIVSSVGCGLYNSTLRQGF